MKTIKTARVEKFFNWYFGIDCSFAANKFNISWLTQNGFDDETFCFTDMAVTGAAKVSSSASFYGFVSALCYIDETTPGGLYGTFELSQSGSLEIYAKITVNGTHVVSFNVPVWEQNLANFFEP